MSRLGTPTYTPKQLTTCHPYSNELRCRRPQHTTRCLSAPLQAAASPSSVATTQSVQTIRNRRQTSKRKLTKGKLPQATAVWEFKRLTTMPARLKLILHAARALEYTVNKSVLRRSKRQECRCFIPQGRLGHLRRNLLGRQVHNPLPVRIAIQTQVLCK